MMQDDIQTTIQWIHDRLPFGIRPGLDRIQALLYRLGNPENKVPVIHVGGTNGKGSVVTYLRCMLEELGLNVGTYTSPYIETFNERISLNGQPISNKDLQTAVAKIKPIVVDLDQNEALKGATEFEVVTAMMFDFFAEKKVDVIIVEVGLGGALDCTNVMVPVVSTIVTVGMDHTDILGNGIDEIARQKAGIIKMERPVVIGKVSQEVQKVLQESADAVDSPAVYLGEDYQVAYHGMKENWLEHFDFQSADGKIKDLTTPLMGQHQVENAGVAIETFQIFCKEQGLSWREKDIRKGIEKASWPGRMERLYEEPLLMLDGAHNNPAVEVLVTNLKQEFKGRDIYILFAAINTKDASSMLEKLSKVPRCQLTVTTFDYPRAYTAENLGELAKMEVTIAPNWQQGLGRILQEASSEDVILVTGSLYFISQVRGFLLEEA